MGKEIDGVRSQIAIYTNTRVVPENKHLEFSVGRLKKTARLRTSWLALIARYNVL